MPLIPPDELLERYLSHAQHCTACLAALQNARIAQTAGNVVIVLSLLAGALPMAALGYLTNILALELEKQLLKGPLPSARRDS